MSMKDFARGFGSIIELFPRENNYNKGKILTKPKLILSDEEALRSDWQIIGNDIKQAINTEKPNEK